MRSLLGRMRASGAGELGESAENLPIRLREGEELLARGEISPGIFWKASAVGVLAVILLLTVFNLGVYIAGVSAVMFVVAGITRYFLLVVLTNDRIVFRAGVIMVETVQLRLNRIESAEVERTIMGMMLNYGNLVITGTGSRVSVIPFLSNAQEIRDRLDEQLENKEKAGGPDKEE